MGAGDPAFAGADASGRAGQHFDELSTCSCPNRHLEVYSNLMPII